MVANFVKDGFEFDSIVYPYNKYTAIKINIEQHNIEKYVEYINEKRIEQAEIVMPNLEFLKRCPTLKKLYIIPSYNATKDFDFSPLYEMGEIESLHCINQYGERMQHYAIIDYSKIHGLKELSLDANCASKNFNKIESLKTLRIGGFLGKNKDLTDLFSSVVLDTLELNECKEQSLEGIEKSKKLQCLYINYNRSLKDIKALGKVKETLRALRIRNCPKIEDFSILKELENLEMLELYGNSSLPDLSFLQSMKKLKSFIFDFNIEDGDLTKCLGLEYVYCSRGRKHYNLKDSDLPKGKFFAGNENIEEWRRLE